MSDYTAQTVEEFRAKAAGFAGPNPDPTGNAFNNQTFGAPRGDYTPDAAVVGRAKQVAGALIQSGDIPERQSSVLLSHANASERAQSIMGAAGHVMDHTPMEGQRNVIVVVDKAEDVDRYMGTAQQLGYGQPTKKTDDAAVVDPEAEAKKKAAAQASTDSDKEKDKEHLGWFAWLKQKMHAAWNGTLETLHLKKHDEPDQKTVAAKPATPPAQKATATPTQAPTAAATQAASQDFNISQLDVKKLDPATMTVPDPKSNKPSVTVVTADQLATVLKNSKPENICLVAADNMECLKKNPEAMAALQRFQGNKVIGNAQPMTLESLVASEDLLSKPIGTSQAEVANMQARALALQGGGEKLTLEMAEKLGVVGGKGNALEFGTKLNHLETLDRLGLEEKEGQLSVKDPAKFQEEARKIGEQRLASGTAVATELPYFGTMKPTMAVTPGEGVNVSGAEQAIQESGADKPAQTTQLSAVAEYARAQQVADEAIKKIAAGESVVLYANSERVSAPALKGVEPWSSVLVDGDKIPTVADVVQQRIQEYANTPGNEDFKAKLGQVTQISRGASSDEQTAAVNQFRNRDLGDFSSLVIVDPSRAGGLNLSEAKNDPVSRPTNVIVAGFDSGQPAGQQLVEMAQTTSRVDAVSPSTVQVMLTDGATADQGKVSQIKTDMALMEAGGSRLAATAADKMATTESQGVSQGQKAPLMMPSEAEQEGRKVA